MATSMGARYSLSVFLLSSTPPVRSLSVRTTHCTHTCLYGAVQRLVCFARLFAGVEVGVRSARDGLPEA